MLTKFLLLCSVCSVALAPAYAEPPSRHTLVIPQERWALATDGTAPVVLKTKPWQMPTFATDVSKSLTKNGLDIPNSALVIGRGIGGGFSIFYAQVIDKTTSQSLYQSRNQPHAIGLSWKKNF